MFWMDKLNELNNWERIKMGTPSSYDGKKDGPPADDVCPICFDDFIVPAKTSCGHWYCASCILLLWSHRGGIKICKCPKCDCCISKLTVDASLVDRRDDHEVVKVMEQVDRYNGMYSEQRHPLRPRMSWERLRRLLISLVGEYLLVAIAYAFVMVCFSFLPWFDTLPDETKENVRERMWWAFLHNILLLLVRTIQKEW